MLNGRRRSSSRWHCRERPRTRHRRLLSPSVPARMRHPTPRSTCAHTTRRAFFSAGQAASPPTFTAWRGRAEFLSSTCRAALLTARHFGASLHFLPARCCNADRRRARAAVCLWACGSCHTALRSRGRAGRDAGGRRTARRELGAGVGCGAQMTYVGLFVHCGGSSRVRTSTWLAIPVVERV